MPDHNMNRLQQYIAKASFAHTADKNAAMKLAATLGGTPSGRAEELITQLEAEIVKRDARVAELEASYQHGTPLHKAVFMALESYTGSDSFDDGVRGLISELAALKAQQPSAGVVLPEPDFYWVEADEGSWNSPEEWAQDYYDYNGEMPESVSFSCAIELPVREYDSFEFDADGSCISCRLVNHEVARLNPCRAQDVPDGLVVRILKFVERNTHYQFGEPLTSFDAEGGRIMNELQKLLAQQKESE